VAQAVYDGTVLFCDRFINRRSRTHDQMVQAARSGVQNIAEGSLASATSKKTELKLTNVARASLGELICDYEDYLRQHRLSIWEKSSPRVLAMRARLAGQLTRSGERTARSAQPEHEPLQAALTALRSAPAEVSANILLCLSHQASYLLKCQLERLEKDFLEKGGFTERMYRYRKEHRDPGSVRERTESDWSDRSDQSD